jgi:hypothetical protein
MALVDRAVFKTYLGVNRAVDLGDDDQLQVALDSATAGINEALDRHVALAGVAAATPRVFATRHSPLLFIDDCTTVTSLVDNTYALTATDYQLEPLNGIGRSGEYRPYSEVRRLGGYWYDSGGWANVTITATWGWAQIPAPIVAACQILAKDILANRDVSFGIAAFTEYAGIRARENPQVWARIQPYSLHVGVG